MARSASRACLGDDDALAGGEPVRLDHDRQFLRRQIGLGRRRVAKTAIGAGRNGKLAAQILGEALRAFELRRRFRGAEDLEPGGKQIVGKSRDERRLRSDHDKIDILVPAKPDHRLMIGAIEA